jgi:ubiquinone/menaquinone biosynthesis C-methylase UbiE
MDPQLEQIREQQKESWNRFSPGWRKWDDLTMDFLKPMGDEIIRLLKLKGDELVLDVAAGTGEPGLSIASMLQGGKVISTDLTVGMLDIAREKAIRQGINNFETRVADVCELPFEDNTFDAISCRFGYMFFPDMMLATKEMVRVLKPGGRIATAVWNVPELNFWVTAMMTTINKNIELPAPEPGAPGMFRCSENGLIAHLFRHAGLTNILESEVDGKLKTGTADVYWDMMTEIAAPVVAAMSKADDATRAKIKQEVFDLLNQKFPDGSVNFDTSALIIYGEK